jgi:hypothetical protein
VFSVLFRRVPTLAMIDAIHAVVPMAALAKIEIRSFDASAGRQNRTIQTECYEDSEQTC